MPGILDMLSQTWPARLAQDVWGGITAPRDAWQGKLDALSPEGIARAGNLAGFIMGGGMAAPAQRNAAGMIRAYHGSPYDFEKFDLSKIGTGEGAQAYGHGLYFAENEGVARSYRNELPWRSVDHGEVGNIVFDTMKGDQVGSKLPFGPNQTLYTRAELSDAFKKGTYDVFSLRPHLRTEIERAVADRGRMYEVNINAKPEQFLDWDKPLAQQPKQVQEFWQQQFKPTEPPRYRADVPIDPNAGFHVPDVRGEGIYQQLSNMRPEDRGAKGLYGSYQNATDAFREAGIPGIKYLDQGSRGNYEVAKRGGDWGVLGQNGNDFTPWRFADKAEAEAKAKYLNDYERTSNYVLFRDDIIDILRKYGLAGTAAGLGATSDQLPIPSQPAPIYAQ